MPAPPEPVPAVLRVEVSLVQNVCSLICDPATAVKSRSRNTSSMEPSPQQKGPSD